MGRRDLPGLVDGRRRVVFVDASLAGMRGLNDMLEGTRLPRLNEDKMEQMFCRDTLSILGISA